MANRIYTPLSPVLRADDQRLLSWLSEGTMIVHWMFHRRLDSNACDFKDFLNILSE